MCMDTCTNVCLFLRLQNINSVFVGCCCFLNGGVGRGGGGRLCVYVCVFIFFHFFY